MDTILKVSHLCKQYSGFALTDVSFELPKGSIMGLIGENGAGKTTTIKAIIGAVRRDSGEISLLGGDNTGGSALKQDLGVVLDDSFFYFMLNPIEIGRILRAAYRNWDDALYRSYLGRFHLPEKKKVKEFSSGMRMKLAIAAALAHHPRLLLLDEPTSGLDPGRSSMCFSISSRMRSTGFCCPPTSRGTSKRSRTTSPFCTRAGLCSASKRTRCSSAMAWRAVPKGSGRRSTRAIAQGCGKTALAAKCW